MTVNDLKHLNRLLKRLGYECHEAAITKRNPLYGAQYRHNLTLYSKTPPPQGKSPARVTMYLMAWGGLRIESCYARLPALGMPHDASAYLALMKLLDKLDEDEQYRRAIGD